jgi:hypothetical protein
VSTPPRKRSSGTHRFLLSVCPACTRDTQGECPLCQGLGVVPFEVLNAYHARAGTPVPDTEPAEQPVFDAPDEPPTRPE